MPETIIGKPWYASKTIWINILAVLAGVMASIQGLVEIGAPITILGIVDIILRVVTKQPLGKTK